AEPATRLAGLAQRVDAGQGLVVRVERARAALKGTEFPGPYYPEEIKKGYRLCARVTRRAARNFFFSFALLPVEQRRSIYAIYAFCRRCDDIVDGPGPLEEKRRALRLEESSVKALYEGRR